MKSSLRSYCSYGIGSMVGTYYSAPAEQKTACQRFSPPGNLPDCVGGGQLGADPEVTVTALLSCVKL